MSLRSYKPLTPTFGVFDDAILVKGESLSSLHHSEVKKRRDLERRYPAEVLDHATSVRRAPTGALSLSQESQSSSSQLPVRYIEQNGQLQSGQKSLKF